MSGPTTFHNYTDTPVRFFIEDENMEPAEVAEFEFADMHRETERAIAYERHTVRENGVSQICLTLGGRE